MKKPVLLALSFALSTSMLSQPQTPPATCPGTQNAKGQASPPPDTIFVNGNIYTQATPARAQAIAVSNGCVVAIGSDEDVRKLKVEHTQVVDLRGHFVMPGFNDAHVHLEEAGLEAQSVDLRGTRSLQEMQQRIAASAKTAAPGSGWWAADGTRHYGRTRSCRIGRILTQSRVAIPRCSAAWMGTSPLPMRPR